VGKIQVIVMNSRSLYFSFLLIYYRRDYQEALKKFYVLDVILVLSGIRSDM